MIAPLLTSVVFFAPPAPIPQDIARGPQTVRYTVAADDLAVDARTVPVRVSMTIHEPPRGSFVVQMPVWTPGSYRYRDFPDRVSDVTASIPDELGEAPALTRTNRHTWLVEHGDARAVQVDYTVSIPQTSRGMVRGNRRRSITYEGPGLYMFARGALDAPCYVTFDLPDDWQVATGLVENPDGTWFAQDYDFLADCPVKIGTFQAYRFESHGKPIDVVLDGPGEIEFDARPWLDNIKKVTDVTGDIFGGFPFDRYVFLYSASPRRGYDGGLEHLTSTTIGISANGVARDPMTGMGTTAHEFFHTWNVKRLRPVELGPFDYTRANRTTSLWIMEGFTSYYTNVILARAGLRTEQQFWRSLQGAIRSFEASPAREHVSSTMSSFRVWEPKPRDRTISYYTTGQVLGLLLDIEMRAATDNRVGLDDLMRALYELCADRGRGFEEFEVESMLTALTGKDFGPWFDRHVRGVLVPDYATTLAKAGVRYEEERSRVAVLRGLTTMGPKRTPYWADPDATGRRLLLNQGSVTRLNGTAFDSSRDLRAALDELEPGAEITLDLLGPAGSERQVTVELGSAPRVTVRLTPIDDADAAARAIATGIVQGR